MINEKNVKVATEMILKYATEVFKNMGFEDYTEAGMRVGNALGGEMLTEYQKHDTIRNAKLHEQTDRINSLEAQVAEQQAQIDVYEKKYSQFNFYKNYYIEVQEKCSERVTEQLKKQVKSWQEKCEVLMSDLGSDTTKLVSECAKLKARNEQLQSAYQANTSKLNKLILLLSKEGIDADKLFDLNKTREITE